MPQHVLNRFTFRKPQLFPGKIICFYLANYLISFNQNIGSAYAKAILEYQRNNGCCFFFFIDRRQ